MIAREYFMDKITNKVMKNKYVKNLISTVDLSYGQFEKVFWLNMKTFPLFYLSFLLPHIIINNTDINTNEPDRP